MNSNRYDIQNVSNISPLASDDEYDGNDFMDYSQELLSTGTLNIDETLEINKHLTAIPGISSYFELQSGNSTFIDFSVDSKPIGLSFSLDKPLASSEFVAISIFCIPNYSIEEDFISQIERKKVKRIDYLDFSFRLVYIGNINLSYNTDNQQFGSEQNIPIKTAIFNGEYCITLTNHYEKLKQGHYILYLSINESEGKHDAAISAIQIQSLKVTYQVLQEVEATAVIPGSSISSKIHPGEYVYYRLVLIEKSKAIRISVRPSKAKTINQSETLDNVLDVFVTNKFCGLYPVSKESAVWSTRCHLHPLLEILPGDVKLALNEDDVASNTFIIAVYADPETVFSELSYNILVEIVDSTPLTSYSLSDIQKLKNRHSKFCYQCNNVQIQPNQFSYFSIDFDPTERSEIVVMMNLLRSSANRLAPMYEAFHDIDELKQKLNIGSSFLQGVVCESVHLFEVLDKLFEDKESIENLGQEPHFFTIACISDSITFPTDQTCTWIATGGDSVTFIIDSNDWKYVGNRCYFSFYSVDLALLFAGVNTFEEINKIRRNIPDLPDFLQYLQSRLPFAEQKQQKINAQCRFWVQTEDEILLNRTLLPITSSTGPSPSKILATKKNSQLKSFRYKLFQEIFQNIDAHRLSFKDRNFNYKNLYQVLNQDNWRNGELIPTLENSFNESVHMFPSRKNLNSQYLPSAILANNYIDDATLSYSEIDFYEFDEFLMQIGAVDGHIFYDLGCGVGKVLVGAMLSGIRFLKVIGIEILPSLSSCCNDIVQKLILENETTANTVHNSSNLALGSSPMRSMNGLDKLSSPLAKRLTSPKGRGNRPEETNEPENEADKPKLPTWLIYDYATKQKKINDSSLLNDTHNSDSEEDYDILRNIRNDEDSFSLFSEEKGFNPLNDNDGASQSSVSYLITRVPKLKEKLKAAEISLPIFEIRNENFLESNWSEADIVFSNSICFSDYFMELLFEKAKLLKRGSKWITCKLPDEGYQDWFNVEKSLSCRLSFGVVEFYVLARV